MCTQQYDDVTLGEIASFRVLQSLLSGFCAVFMSHERFAPQS